MEKIKKYKKQIFTFITILLLLQFGIFPCLTMANTFANIVGGIGLLILVIWGILEIKDIYDSEK
jgi:ABC-type multidrug transport system permease subunit